MESKIHLNQLSVEDTLFNKSFIRYLGTSKMETFQTLQKFLAVSGFLSIVEIWNWQDPDLNRGPGVPNAR